MRFAFATSITAAADLQSLVGRARECGYEGVQLSFLPNNVDFEVACLASSISMPVRRRSRAGAAAELVKWFNIAKQLNCHRVKIPGYLAPPGHPANAAAVEFARWLSPLGDQAADRGVTLVVENSNSFQKAKDVWTLLESVNHSNIAACWNLQNAIRAGESPFISVPTLNSRIQYLVIGDCNAGDTEAFITRLRGIGYGGYVTVDAPDAMLADAIGKLRDWTKAVQPPASGKSAIRSSR